MKVYVIAQGEYATYHIIGVTLDREVAEKCVKVHEAEYDPPRIEEYDTNQFPQYTRKAWRVIFNPYEIKEITLTAYLFFLEYSNADEQYVLADTEAHALKIAQDRRAKLLAEKAGL